MVFGEPVYNTEQRRAILQQFKDYIDKIRKKKGLPSWDEVIKRQEEEEKEEKQQKKRTKKRKNLSKIKKRKRKRRKRTRKINFLKLKKLLCNDWYIK